jgi:uncharacterized protein YlzI (FlbEa/FlbD family)
VKLNKLIPREPLLYLAAAFQSIQFGLAGSIYFGSAGWVIGGLGGIVVNFSVAKSASKISDIAKTRRKLAWTGFVGLMLLSPLAVAPAGFIQLGIVSNFWLRVVTAVVWAIIPDTAILLTGAVTGKSLVRDEDEELVKKLREENRKLALQAKQAEQEAVKKAKQEAQEKEILARKKRISDADLLAYLQQHAGESDDQIAEHFGVTRQAIQPRRKKLMPQLVEATKTKESVK